MPQLDIVSYFSQYVWLMVFYIGFYFLLVNSFLPKLSRILKVRSAKIQKLGIVSENVNTGNENPEVNFLVRREESAIRRIQFAQKSLRNAFVTVDSWIKLTERKLNSKRKATVAFKLESTRNAVKHARVLGYVENLLSFSSKLKALKGKNQGVQSIASKKKNTNTSRKTLQTFYTKKFLSVF